jgi:hypothetical protein
MGSYCTKNESFVRVLHGARDAAALAEHGGFAER